MRPTGPPARRLPSPTKRKPVTELPAFIPLQLATLVDRAPTGGTDAGPSTGRWSRCPRSPGAGRLDHQLAESRARLRPVKLQRPAGCATRVALSRARDIVS
jgi:hypothetical protein